MDEFHFSKTQIGFLQTVFFVTYAFFQVPSGVLSEWFGHRRIVALALAWWSIFTSLTAVCSSFASWIVVRALFGVGEAPVWPGLNAAYYNWFPKHERGRAVAMMLIGSKMGPVFCFPVATMLLIEFGWRSSFWIFGGVGLLLALAYYVLLRTYPHESRFVNRAELEYIAEDKQVLTSQPEKIIAPWIQFLRSPQFWAVGGQLGMANFVQYVFIAWLPVYLLEAHHFSLKAMGFAAMVPEFSFAVGAVICGFISDYLIGRKIVDSRARAWLGGSGQIFCCLSLCLTATCDDKVLTIFGLSVALALLGFSMNCTWTSAADLGGKFAGSVAGWTNFLGNLIGGAAPLVIGWVASEWGWQAAFTATALSGILGAICWAFVRPHQPLKGSGQEPAGGGLNADPA
jgi:ACS family glucarate transporter-like MFS transporter